MNIEDQPLKPSLNQFEDNEVQRNMQRQLLVEFLHMLHLSERLDNHGFRMLLFFLNLFAHGCLTSSLGRLIISRLYSPFAAYGFELLLLILALITGIISFIKESKITSLQLTAGTQSYNRHPLSVTQIFNRLIKLQVFYSTSKLWALFLTLLISQDLLWQDGLLPLHLFLTGIGSIVSLIFTVLHVAFALSPVPDGHPFFNSSPKVQQATLACSGVLRMLLDNLDFVKVTNTLSWTVLQLCLRNLITLLLIVFNVSCVTFYWPLAQIVALTSMCFVVTSDVVCYLQFHGYLELLRSAWFVFVLILLFMPVVFRNMLHLLRETSSLNFTSFGSALRTIAPAYIHLKKTAGSEYVYDIVYLTKLLQVKQLCGGFLPEEQQQQLNEHEQLITTAFNKLVNSTRYSFYLHLMHLFFMTEINSGVLLLSKSLIALKIKAKALQDHLQLKIVEEKVRRKLSEILKKPSKPLLVTDLPDRCSLALSREIAKETTDLRAVQQHLDSFRTFEALNSCMRFQVVLILRFYELTESPAAPLPQLHRLAERIHSNFDQSRVLFRALQELSKASTCFHLVPYAMFVFETRNENRLQKELIKTFLKKYKSIHSLRAKHHDFQTLSDNSVIISSSANKDTLGRISLISANWRLVADSSVRSAQRIVGANIYDLLNQDFERCHRRKVLAHLSTPQAEYLGLKKERLVKLFGSDTYKSCAMVTSISENLSTGVELIHGLEVRDAQRYFVVVNQHQKIVGISERLQEMNGTIKHFLMRKHLREVSDELHHALASLSLGQLRVGKPQRGSRVAESQGGGTLTDLRTTNSALQQPQQAQEAAGDENKEPYPANSGVQETETGLQLLADVRAKL